MSVPSFNTIIQYFVSFWKRFDAGELGTFPDPADPVDLGNPLTQDEIDFVKRLKKEMEERFTGGDT
ncbi:MAG TPA: hypothetical protein VK666_21700 [Chryseolinea sp.]|nr:hypothetical protein [Chryseolinea sp.]